MKLVGEECADEGEVRNGMGWKVGRRALALAIGLGVLALSLDLDTYLT